MDNSSNPKFALTAIFSSAETPAPSQDAAVCGSNSSQGLAGLPAAELSVILDRAITDYGAGTSIYAIADELGIEHTTLYRQLVKHRESDWRDAKIGRSLSELEEAEDALKIAPDMLALTRARERCRAAQWQLERLLRRLYGQDHNGTVAQAVQININLRGAEMGDKP